MNCFSCLILFSSVHLFLYSQYHTEHHEPWGITLNADVSICHQSSILSKIACTVWNNYSVICVLFIFLSEATFCDVYLMLFSLKWSFEVDFSAKFDAQLNKSPHRVNFNHLTALLIIYKIINSFLFFLTESSDESTLATIPLRHRLPQSMKIVHEIMYKVEVLYVLCVLLMGRQRNQARAAHVCYGSTIELIKLN